MQAGVRKTVLQLLAQHAEIAHRDGRVLITTAHAPALEEGDELIDVGWLASPGLAGCFLEWSSGHMQMNEDRWRYTSRYLKEIFGAQDAHLEGLMDEAITRGLPDIAVSPDVGRLLKLLTSMTAGRLAIEVGTLGGYSAIWLARGLLPHGRLITIENEAKHARFARTQFERAGLADRVDLVEGDGVEELRRLSTELEAGSVDVLFLDADKAEYPEYFRVARHLIASGGLLIADNALGSGSWWIDDEAHPQRAGAHQLNVAAAEDPEFEAVAVPLREGLLVARRTPLRSS